MWMVVKYAQKPGIHRSMRILICTAAKMEHRARLSGCLVYDQSQTDRMMHICKADIYTGGPYFELEDTSVAALCIIWMYTMYMHMNEVYFVQNT